MLNVGIITSHLDAC